MPQPSTFVLQFFLYWLLAYATLAGIYLVLGIAISRFNQWKMQAYRIQSKDCPADLIRRDQKQSLKSLVSITGMLSAGLALRSVGVSITPAETSILSFLLWAPISIILFDTWFYWLHRLAHTRRLYVRVHQWHHRATTPTVWSNNSDTLLDNLLLQSYWFFAPLLLPAPTLVLVAHKIYDQITGMFGHAGFEYAPGQVSAFPSPLVGTSFHDLHHSGFNYNFATHFSIWDRLMGTVHPDYDRSVKSFPKPGPYTAFGASADTET